jgi:hypothetical protein
MKQRGCSGAAMELPFSQTHLARFAREQGVNIRGLFTQHREQIGKTIESLSDFLTRQTSLSKNLSENAQASLRTMRGIMAILIQASLVRGLIS